MVMQKMKIPEKLLVMHDPVAPVKIGIMHNEHEWKSQKEIKPAMRLDPGVKGRVRGNMAVLKNEDRHSCKNANGKGRKDDFS